MWNRILRFAPVVLVLALTLCAGCADTQTQAAASSGRMDLSVDEFKQKVDEFQGRPGEAVILDVRTREEFESGHLRDAVNLDYNAGVFRDRAARMDRQKTYLVYCLSGTRSAHAADILVELGFTSVYNLKGGIAKWKGAGYPTVSEL